MKKSDCVYLAVLLSILTFNNYIFPQWSQVIGPYGGVVTAVASLDSVCYCGTHGGSVYKSTDNGMTWSLISGTTNLGTISALLINNSGIFVGTYNGVYLTSDNGKTWMEINTGLTNTSINAFAREGGNIFAATGGGGVYMFSVGNYWSSFSKGLSNLTVLSLAVEGDTLYAGTQGGLYLSTNGGLSWKNRGGNGLPTVGGVNAITINGNYLFAGNWGQGVYRIGINDNTWVQMQIGGANYIFSLNSYEKYVCVSAMGGGLYASSDYGSSWTSLNDGFSGTIGESNTIYNLAFSRTNILAATAQGIFYSPLKSATTTWTPSDNGMWPGNIGALAFNGTNLIASGSIIGHYGYTNAVMGGVFVSSDNGSDWGESNLGGTIQNFNIGAFCFACNGTDIYAGGTREIYVSTDNGGSWNSLDPNNNIGSSTVYSIVILNSKIFLGTDQGVFTSNMSGGTWTSVSNGLPNTSQDPYLAAVGNNLFYSRRTLGVYRSTDFGNSWSACNNGLTALSVLSLTANGTDIYATFEGGNGVAVSHDNGNSWTMLNNGLYSAGSAYSLVLSGQLMFACTQNGVYVSGNKGLNWGAVNTGLPNNTAVFSLLADGNYLYAGTNNLIWKRPVDEMTEVKYDNILPGQYELKQNFPNPFNPATTIKYQVPEQSFVMLKVYDILGKEVCSLVNEVKKTGEYEVQFDGSKLSSGVYFYQLRAGNFVETKKLLLLK